MKGERDILIDTQEPVDKRAREKQKQKKSQIKITLPNPCYAWSHGKHFV